MAKSFVVEKKNVREPLFRVEKRDTLPKWKKTLIYAIAIIGALFLGGTICSIASPKGNPFTFFGSLFKGVFNTGTSIWETLKEMALLVAVSMALLPAFKMKFWNLGGNGQILIGGLAANICMWYLGGVVADVWVIILSVISSIVAGAIWAVIPAIFKAFFNTNESLFTLMMNYIAQCLVTLFIAMWVKSGSSVLTDNMLPYGRLPMLGNRFLLTILVGAAIFGFVFVFLKFTKGGYELSVVGDSQNTARYVGIKVKKVIIKTLIMSGAICGIVGLMLTSGNYANAAIGTGTAKDMGFTAIMTTWLANCNPIAILGTCGLVAFINKGMTQVRMDFQMTGNSFSNLVVGLIYFFIIACSFFVQYKLIMRKKKKEENKL